jgi:hypothetical protein
MNRSPKRIPKPIEFDAEIDEITNSIKDVATGRELPTEVVRVLSVQRLQIKKKQWLFNWHLELDQPGREVHKLIAVEDPATIHGLICLEDLGDHVFAHLLESASFNRGRAKKYSGVGANLVAYACQLSFDKGYLGYVSFLPKSNLVEHYTQTLGAKSLGNQRMMIDTIGAKRLVDAYFNKH